ncbi:non-ribosomal peptide synthetase/type I polyketide synthase [Hydrogenophaga sp. 2FB]|uniref:non-ribosomal peptide synthetase/type I polyketide synthase n=1 Tax=Hydrogenophaga sp. 2FB TaxID=2502187 RepID=UPI0010F5B59B|nr:non-ribosomal peptide synthetase/type I polyketide synthase [Hydrogenophaga sp. 2FB]
MDFDSKQISTRSVSEIPLTSAQRAVANTIPLAADATLAWNEARALRIRGSVDHTAILAAIQTLIARHDALNLHIQGTGMLLARPPAAEVQRVDLSSLPQAGREERLQQVLHSLVMEPLDIQQGRVFRVVMVDLGHNDLAVGLVAHHVVCDGWSFGILIEELVALYQTQVGGSAAPAALEAAPSFIQFARDEIAGPAAVRRETDLTYWESVYADAWPTLDLPTDRARGAVRTFASQRQELRLEPDLVARLKSTAGRQGASLFSILCAGYAALLARLSGSSDVVIAVPAAAQLSEGLDRLVGQCVSHLPVRLAVDVDAPANALLATTQHAVLDAYDHMSCGLELLLERFNPASEQGRLPLACVKFNLNPSLDAAVLGLQGVQCAVWTPPRVAEHFELFLNAEQDARGILLCCQHNSDLFDGSTVRRWLDLYQQILVGLADNLDQPLAKLLIPVGEDQTLLTQFNANHAWLDRSLRVEAMIDAHVQRTPDAIAVSAGEETLTFLELQRRAYGVAEELRKRGVQAGDLVGLSCGRNHLMMVGVYGILKAGAGYVPLDPSFPVDRLDFMAEDAALSLVLCDESVADSWKPAHSAVLMLDHIASAAATPPANGAHSEMPAYVIYTSGSTGKPKGVRVPHRSVVNLLQSVAQVPGMGPSDVVLAVTTLSFDIAVSEVILPMTVGARIVVADRAETTDGTALRALIERQQVNFVDATPSTWRLLLAAGWPGHRGMKAICTGEPLPPDLATELIPRVAELWNGYGPTETTVWSSFHHVTSPSVPIPIGKPVQNTQFHVLDPSMRPLPVGVTGELWIGGDGVTLGYLNRPDLTAERFVPDPFSSAPGACLYKTGDLGRWRADGILECLGRADHQVKVRGYRIELGEIEVQLCAHPAVARAVVITREDRPGDVRLVAYVVPHQAMPSVSSMREHLSAHLPEYMVPQHFVPMVEIPLLPNGKINRHALLPPSGARPELSVPYQAPVNALEAGCCEVFGTVLSIDQVGRLDNFFDLGGNSLLAMRVLEGLTRLTGKTLSAPTIFAHPSPATLAECLAPPSEQNEAAVAIPKKARRVYHDDDPIAIVGMAGRFPGAATVEALWDNLIAGRDAITQFTLDTLDPSVPSTLRDDPNYVKARGVVDGIELFDNAFFGISAREAEVMDPQHRVFLEIAWECLERAGYAPDRTEQAVGVFAGVYTPTYLHRNVMAHPEAIDRLGEFQVMVGNDKDYVATRVAHKLNLKGPAIAIHTACSTSLVAIAQAVDSLRLGRCDMALAGAASVTSPPRSGYLYQEGAMLSRDGHTRTFDGDASGTAFNDGAAVLLLKRLSDAQADGDHVFALIRGIATNNDGGGKASFTAPSVQGQAAVIAAAHEDAGVDPRSISYVEAHGTATPLGDPVEVEGLTRAFRRGTKDTGFCRIGSVKSNVGHLVTAAGATGVIKTALALATEQLPATIHFDRPNPNIDFANSPFVVNSERTPWPRGPQPRRAGVSSFGVGGTNAHAVLEEAPLVAPSAATAGPQLLQLSARTRSALDVMAQQLAEHLTAHPDLNLADAAHTLRVGRSRFAHRLTVVGASPADCVDALRTGDHAQRALREVGAAVPPLVWLFPGQGAQYAGMGRELYAHDDAFRVAFDECLEALKDVLPYDLKARMFDGGPDALVATDTTQPATFALEYALARSWLAQGARPQALVGHSVGEFAAAVLAGVMPLADAARLVARRGALMQALPGGSMLSVRLSLDKLMPLLPPELSLAAENGPSACVVAGPTPAVQAWQAQLEADGIVARLLQTSHAFHSSMMHDAVAPFEAAVRQVRLSAPQIPIISTLTGQAMQASEATDPGYWARHLREAVRFSPAIKSALATGEVAFLEIGPRGTLSTLVRQHGAGKRAAVCVPSLGDAPETETALLLHARGQLWTLGLELAQPVANQGRRRVRLPTYPFERKRFWLDAALPSAPLPQAAPQALSASTLPDVSAAAVAPTISTTIMSTATPSPASATPSNARPALLAARLRALFEDVAGVDIDSADSATGFLELGLDSLSLTQAALQVKKTFNVALTFRQLMEKYRSIDALAQFLDGELPPDQFAPPAPVPSVAAPVAAPVAVSAAMPAAMSAAAATYVAPAAMPMALLPGDASAVHQLMQQQMQLMAQQLAVLAGQPLPASLPVPPTVAVPAAMAAPAAAAAPSALAPTAATAPGSATDPVQPSLKSLVEKPFGASPRLTLQAQGDFTPDQRRWLDDFIARSTARSAKSKAFSQQYRKVMADPRVVTGFNPLWKDLIYPLVVNRSSGASMWDLDGNEYIDLLSCFGGNLLGYQPAGVAQALHQQVDQGFEVGPQHPLAAEVAKLMTEFTGMERVGFCNTGSEAVMGAMRIARTVTGRKTIAIFSNSYHGIFDEVVVRGTKQLRSVSAAPGILANTVENILVLDWNSEDSLRILRERGHDLAAIMTEPIQNKYPTIQPREFVQSLRQIADKAGCALIFDEVVTGFRVAPGGAQEFYGVRADIATYGKVIGGGLPFAAIAGNANWLDALDGGHWQFGDDSYPEAGVTYFAGTFVRHPLALAAAHATLLHIKQGGRAFYRDLNDRTQRLIDRLNTAFAVRGAPVKAVHCASIWRLQWDDNQKYVSLFYHLARFKGMHLYEQFGHFVTAGMTDEHTDRIFRAFTETIDELMGLGFILPKDGTPPPPPKGGIETGAAQRTEAQITPGQNERWLAGGFDPSARRALNESLCVSLKGPVDRTALQQALHDVLTRHDTFRVQFNLDEPRQTLAPAKPIPVAEVDLRQQADADKALDDFCSQASLREFPLDQAPLAAVSLLDLADGRVVVHVVASHLVFDGWASSVFNAELATAYKARSMGMPPPFKPAESPLDFAEEEQARFESPDGQEALRFWQQQLRNPPTPLNLGDRTPATPRSFAADTCSMRIDGEAFGRLRAHARQSGVTLFQLLLTAVTLMLHKRSGQGDFVVCIPYASQSLQQHGPLMADGVLDLPLRLTCAQGESTDAVLQRVRSHLMDALEHPLITQGTVARALGIRSSGDRPALTGIYFNLNPKVDLSAYAPLQATMHEGRKRGLLSQLFFNFYEQDDALTLDLHHSSEYFSLERARELVEALKTQIHEMAAPASATLPVLTAVVAPIASAAAVPGPVVDPRLIAWNKATATPQEPHGRVEQWVARQAAATPEAVALISQGVSLSYAALESRANRFGQLLRSRGIGAGMLVGVCLARGPDLVPALLGILKTGAAYVPLDPGFPKDRLHYMAEDAGVRLVITDAANASLSGVPREQQIRLDDDVASIASASDSALPRQADWADNAPMYVIYTSGSTGKPKGVVLPQNAVCNFLASMRREPGLQAGDRLLAVTTLSFDIAVLELFLPLTTGASVVLAQREDAMDGEALARLITEQRINVMQATPTTWHMLLDAGWRAPTGMRALCGGEPLPPSLAERLLGAGLELWNMYGPTETTVWSTLCRITDAKQKITIGHPIDNTQVWILDEQMKPCPIGQEGELCIGGAGVATGYFKRPELTAEKFVADPFDAAPGARIYRTGDLARWREDGTLEHLGRLDFQVKIRGYRIELGEIEARLAALPGIARTVVMAREDSPGDVRLVGYAVPHAGPQPDPTALREALRGGLPDYMLPQQIVLLDTMPLLPNGKIDRKALPAPTGPAPAMSTGEVKSARNDTEKAVVDAMQTVLKLSSVGIDEDFFALGGHSLLAAKVIGQLNKALGLQLNLRMLFESPSAEKLARRIDEQRGSTAPQRAPIVHRSQQQQGPLTLMQERIRFIEEMQPDRVVYNVPSAHRLRGHMQLEAFDRAFNEVVRRQHALRTTVTRVGNAFVQSVTDDVPFSLLPLEDLSALPAAQREAALQARVQELVSHPFALDHSPLFKARLFRLDADHHVFFFMTHHVIWDGWSFDLLYEEMNANYKAFCEGNPAPLPALALSYGDFAEWHGKWLEGEELAQQMAFWKDQFQKHPVKAPQADFTRQPGAHRIGAIEFKKVTAAEADHVRDVAKRTGSTLSIVALSVYAVILSQLLREPTPTVGVPVRGRPHPDLEPIMGFFNNMLPVRLPVDPSLTWVEWIGRVRATVVAAFSNQDVPFERIASALEAEQPGVHGSLYQAMFTFQDARNRPTQWGDLAHERVLVHHKGSTEDLNLGLVEIPSGIEVSVQYDTGVYLPTTAQAVRDRFLSMLAAVAADPTQAVSRLMSPDAQALQALQALDAPVVASDDLLNALSNLAQQHGSTAVVRTASATVDAKELEHRVAATAQALPLPTTGSPGTVIVALSDPVAQLVAALAVLRAGHACLSVDADDVPGCLADASGAACWVLADTLPGGGLPANVVRIDTAAVSGYSAAPSASLQAQTATALAKTPSLPVNREQWSLVSAALATQVKLLGGDQILALSPTPASHLALLGLALRTGAALVFTTQAMVNNGNELVRRMTTERVGLVHADVNVWNRIREARQGASLPVIAVLDVQESSTDLVAGLLDAGANVLSMYQPGAGALPVAAGWIAHVNDFNLFGRPLVAQTLQVAERAGEPVAVGMSAPLWLRASRGDRWATPGALVRWRSDGQLQYLGETRAETILAGQRIALEALERVAIALPGVAAAAVGLGGDAQGRRLVVGLQPTGDTPIDNDRAMASLKAALPLAARGVLEVRWFERIARTSDGRLHPTQSVQLRPHQASVSTRPSGNTTAQEIQAVWSELLGIAHIRPHDNFFDLGGTSLTAMQAVQKLEQRIGKQISPRRYVSETLAQLAAAYDGETTASIPASTVKEKPASNPSLIERLVRLVHRA